MYEKTTLAERPKFKILDEERVKIEKKLAQIKDLDNEIIQSWKEELCVKYAEYSIIKDNLDSIVENLQLFMTRMLLRHGVECVALLYPEKEKVNYWLKSIEGNILDSLPKIDSFTDAILRLEIPSFFKKPDPKRKIYITGLFNSSFFWHLVQVDEKCSRLLSEVTKGQRLYLDNNILYSLAGLHGPFLLQSVNSMLRLTKLLGYELWVTTKTIEEFHNSLVWQCKELNLKPPPPAYLVRIAKENLEEDSIIACYWRDFVEKGITIEEFISEKSHLENILEVLEIKKTNKFRRDIEESSELQEEESILRSTCSRDWGEHIIEHDAFHRIFINKIRKGPKYYFSDAVAWFLTHDTKLPIYDKVARKGKDCLPFCIMSDQWIQINRPLLARTANQKEYDESFHLLVTQPFLRAMMPGFSLERAYNEVISRVSRYKKMNPQLALNIVTDRHFMVNMALETDEKRISEKVDEKIVDEYSQLQSKTKDLENSIQSKDKKIDNLVNRINEVEKEMTKLSNYEQKIGELKGNLQREQDRSKKLQIEKVRLVSRIKKLIKWGIFGFSLIPTSFFLWGYKIWFICPFLDVHKNAISIKLASQLVLIFSLLNIPLGKYWKTWVSISVIFAASILGILCI